jgi:hypothetical protein
MTKLADDPLARWLRSKRIKVDRQTWIDFNWGSTPPEPWTAETEAMLPDELQESEPDELDEETETPES